MNIAAIIPSFNDAHVAQLAIEALLMQELPTGCALDIIFVDDGSTDDGPRRISRRFGDGVRIVTQPQNMGRSRTRNAGANVTSAEFLLFLDADCIPSNRYFIQHYVNAIQFGADVIFGGLAVGNDLDFWLWMQRSAIRSRRKRFSDGEFWAPTSANFLVRIAMFRACGGFDEHMRGYGFEDRDLFLRLAALDAKFSFCDKAVAMHQGEVNFASLQKKHYDAGAFNATLFQDRHPDAYRRMALSHFDANLHPSLQRIGPGVVLLSKPFVRSVERWVQIRWLPFKVRATFVQFLYGCAFLKGTLVSSKHR